ncbi:MAG: hypothetical protein JRF40_05785 [Deltaproteobacteria bacterium]|nr:hypothetical protein [Deltaproteobacteria bacterium]
MTEEQRIRDVMKDVLATFSQLDIAAWLQCFHFPFQIVSSEGIFAPSSKAEGQKMMEPFVDSLRAKGFKRTQLEKCSVKLLSNTTAIASIVFSRFYGEDNVIEQLGGTYFFFKADNLWRVTMVTTHSPDVMVISESND